MSNTKAPHHRGRYQQQAAKIRAAANADPTTRCWRCRRTLAQIRVAKPKARWTAGHIIDGTVDGPLAAECSPCNFAAGARLTNARRDPRPNPSRRW